MNSFEDNDSVDPTLTANTIVNDHQQSYYHSSEEEKVTVPSSNNVTQKGKILTYKL